jgi:probable phosphoglycerate mutase
LTDNGCRLAERMWPMLAGKALALVLCSPMQRAWETCELAGFGDKTVIDCDLVEWNNGEYERLTPKQIHDVAPGWLIFRDGCPGGEAPEQVGARVDRVIARARAASGDVALFAHGHVLRVFAARWIGLPAGAGQHFLLDTGTLCVLGYYRDIPAGGSGTGLSLARARSLPDQTSGSGQLSAKLGMLFGDRRDRCGSPKASVQSRGTSTTPSCSTSTV